MLRVRDAMDRAFAQPLDLPALAKLVHMSEAHLSRTFRTTYGEETPHRYLQRRRVERSMAMLAEDKLSVTEICFAVGFSSLGTFSRRFNEIIGVSPTEFRSKAVAFSAPTCFIKAWQRPVSFGSVPLEKETR
jgi:transcriptional regulator GlxA family with amidase domain